MRVALVVEYDGSAYCGWQSQKHCRSVQQALEAALSTVADQTITVHCAGRTDTGVHACAQVVHFDTQAERSARAWMLGANSNLPDDICIRNATQIDDGFHARYDAVSRQYRYLICNTVARHALHAQRCFVVHEALDVAAMDLAAQALVGEHDFSSFRAAGCQAKHARRSVEAVRVRRTAQWVIVDIAANAFLHHMVRNIVGALIDVGKRSAPPETLSTLLALEDRRKAPAMAGASGLYLSRVCYTDSVNRQLRLAATSQFPAVLPLVPVVDEPSALCETSPPGFN
ncbi:MAG: tRNA pseudouridine(38-40) synthase TruA [Pseudomonadota bacterium]